ncbi:MAG: MATE family efflux transporter [Oscillospiraceae bacterium]|nr:MATE family efflux transporter [Oscillospiraceae bacterium]
MLFSNRDLIRLIVPLIIEQTLTTMVGMLDGVMVSSCGEAAISGVSLVDMINVILLQLFAALATGGAVVTSQYLGARQPENARRSVNQLVLMALAFGMAAMAVCLVLSHELLDLFFGAIEEDVRQAALTYFHITALSFPFIAVYNAGAAMFRSMGNSKISMLCSGLMNVINVGGNALCIYGLKMGVAGAAIPTLVARAAAAVLVLVLASRPTGELYIDLKRVFCLEKKLMGRILHIGVPSAFENSLFALGRVTVVGMIAVYGTSQTTANAVAGNLTGMGVIVGPAIGLAMITVIGRCVGARDTDQAVYYMKKLMLWACCALAVNNLAVILLLPQLIGLYGTLTGETAVLARTLILIHTIGSIFMWAGSFVMPNALRAANDVRYTLVVGISSMLICRVGISWLLCIHMGWGATGVYTAMMVDWFCRTTCFGVRALSGKWKTKYKPT